MSPRFAALTFCFLVALPSCGYNRATSNTPRTATEQLLLTDSIVQAVEASALPDVSGRSVTVTTASLAQDAEVAYAKTALEARLRRDGANVVAEDADMTMNAMIGTSGTDDRRITLGIPEINSVGFAFPGLYIFDFHRQLGFTKLTIETTDSTGAHVVTSTPVLGESHFNIYRWFVFFVFRSDDIFQPGYDWHFGVS